MACFIGTELQRGRGDDLAEEHLKITKYEETGHVTKGFLYEISRAPFRFAFPFKTAYFKIGLI